MGDALQVLIVNFDEDDVKAMQKHFDDSDWFFFADTADGEGEAIEKAKTIMPELVIINITEDEEVGMRTIRQICADASADMPPFFITALYTDEPNSRKNPYTRELAALDGLFLPRYGVNHDVTDIIEMANEMAAYI